MQLKFNAETGMYEFAGRFDWKVPSCDALYKSAPVLAAVAVYILGRLVRDYRYFSRLRPATGIWANQLNSDLDHGRDVSSRSPAVPGATG